MGRWVVAAAVISLSVLVAACGSSISSGIVLHKSYTPASSHIVDEPIPHTTCTEVEVGTTPEDECSTTYFYVPETQFDPADWQIELQDGSNTGWIDVTQSVYNRTAVGSYFGRSH